MLGGSLFSLGSSKISLLDFFIKKEEFFFFVSAYSLWILLLSLLDSFMGWISAVFSLRYLVNFCFSFSVSF